MKKILRHVVRIDLYISCTALAVLILITFTGVIARYFLNAPYTWGEEVQLALIVWVIWYGASAAFRYGNQICVDMVVDLFPKKVQKVIEIVIFLIAAVMLGYLFSQSVTYVSQLARTNRTTEVLHIPKALIYSCMPIGCGLMILNFTYATWRDVILGRGKTTVEEAIDNG